MLGLSSRRGVSATILAVAVITTGAAALGPLYARAAAETTLRQRLLDAPAPDVGLSFTTKADVTQADPYYPVTSAVPKPGSLVGFPRLRHVLSVHTNVSVPSAGGSGTATYVVWRADLCAHLVLVAGRCPRRGDEALANEATLGGGYGWALGRRIRLDDVLEVANIRTFEPTPKRVKIVGSYRPHSRTDTFWFGHDEYFLSGSRGDNPVEVEAVFVDRSFFGSLVTGTEGRVSQEMPLDPTSVRLDDVRALRERVAALVRTHPFDSAVPVTTGLPGVLDASARERRALGVGSLLVTLELAALAALVLFLVVADASEARGDEIALAKVRGLRPRTIVEFGLLEVVVLLVVAVPLGLLLGWLGAKLLAGRVLLPGTPVLLRPSAVVATLLALLGGLLAAALAARRTLTRPVLEQWRRATQRARHARAGLVLDALVVAAAVAATLRLRLSSGRPVGSVALLAPSLMVLAVALVGVRLIPVLGRVLLPWSRGSRRVGLFLALRQVLRRPAALRLAVLLAVASGTAIFAVQARAVSVSNGAARAALEVGADRVASLIPRPDQDVLAAVRRADRSGHWAMAAAVWLPAGGVVSGRVLALDSPRLPAVAAWRPDYAGMSAAEVVATLHPPVAGPISVRGDRLRVTVSAARLRWSVGPPTVVLEIRTGVRRLQVRAGPLGDGTSRYSAAVPCTRGCAFTGVTFERALGDTAHVAGMLVLRSVEAARSGTWRPVDLRLARPGAWSSGGYNPNGSEVVTAAPDGVRDAFESIDAGYPSIATTEFPKRLPALVTPSTLRAGDPRLVDEELNSALIKVTREARTLPRVLDDGALVDLSYLQPQLANLLSEARWEVWLSAAAPRDALARLRAAGLAVDDVTSTDDRERVLAHEGPPLALLLFVACAGAGAVLGAGTTLVAVAVSGRRRSLELAALRAIRVPVGALSRACVGEQLLLLGCGLLLGVPAGLVAARLAMPSVPLFAEPTPLPLRYPVSLGAAALFLVISAALLFVCAVVAGRLLVRAAVPERLREAAL
jgi:hypothetical protein